MLCEALVAAVGLDKDRDPTSLGPGSSQARNSLQEKCVFGDIFLTFFQRFSDVKERNERNTLKTKHGTRET